MPSTKKTYTLLIDIQPPIPILTCSQVLPNRAQCWRGADYLVEEQVPTPAPTPQTPPTQTPQTQPASFSEPAKKEGPIKTLEHKIEAAIEHKKEEKAAPTPEQKTEAAPTPTAEEKKALTPSPLNPEPQETAGGFTTRTFQLCSTHAIIMQRADALADQQEASGQVQPPAGEKGSIHSKMMQAEQVRQTTNMPRGEARG